MTDVQNSDEIQSRSAMVAREWGCQVHHDIHGWYVVYPWEDEPEDGSSLGFDGREHFALCADAWDAACTFVTSDENEMASA